MNDNIYKLPEHTGTLWCMEVEMVNKLPYNHKYNDFSFAIVFWEIWSMDHTFSDFSSMEHMTCVVQHEDRPHLSDKWPCSIKNLTKYFGLAV